MLLVRLGGALNRLQVDKGERLGHERVAEGRMAGARVGGTTVEGPADEGEREPTLSI